jgi:hypothetical protein
MDGLDEQDGGGKERPQMDKINTDWGKGRILHGWRGWTGW